MFVLLTGLVQRTWEERVRKICEPTAARFHYQELTPLLKCGQLSIWSTCNQSKASIYRNSIMNWEARWPHG